MTFEKLGDWCKWLEKNFSNETAIPTLPVIIRLDGNNFSKWTKGLKKPFDDGLIQLMIETTRFLVEETNAVVGYTQSDEITLILFSDDRRKQIYNDGKKQKVLSKLTAQCVSFFNENRAKYLPNHNKTAFFDCRIYQCPTLHDAAVQLLWRENDAIKNSISMLGQAHYKPSQLFKMTANEVQTKLLEEKKIDWLDLPINYQRGTYVKKKKVSKPFTPEELSMLPSRHNAHQNPNLIIERNVYSLVEYPQLSTVKNKADLIFLDAEPVLFNSL